MNKSENECIGKSLFISEPHSFSLNLEPIRIERLKTAGGEISSGLPTSSTSKVGSSDQTWIQTSEGIEEHHSFIASSNTSTPFHFYIKVKEKKSDLANLYVGPTAACRRPERSPTLNQRRHTTQTGDTDEVNRDTVCVTQGVLRLLGVKIKGGGKRHSLCPTGNWVETPCQTRVGCYRDNLWGFHTDTHTYSQTKTHAWIKSIIQAAPEIDISSQLFLSGPFAFEFWIPIFILFLSEVSWGCFCSIFHSPPYCHRS